MLAVITVTELGENPSLNPIDDGKITLREEVDYVNGRFVPPPADLASDNIVGPLAVNDPLATDKIVFARNVKGTIALGLNFDIGIQRPVMIEGSGPDVLTIDVSGNDIDPNTPDGGATFSELG